MIYPSHRVPIMVATKPIDLRKRQDSLAAMAGNGLPPAFSDLMT